jgi:DNA double-strand break repair helicase HerA and related ATPase
MEKAGPGPVGAGAPAESAPAPKERHKEAAGAAAGGVAAIGKFLQSKQGKQLERQVMRGVFGMLKKRL